MAHLFQKQEGGAFHIRFRHDGHYYKRSLKTVDRADAEDRLLGVKRMLHRLQAGKEQIPPGINPGTYIFSEGCVSAPDVKRASVLTLSQLVQAYIESQKNRVADSYRDSQRTHLGHLRRLLGAKADHACSEVTDRDLDRFIEKRLSERAANTVIRERNTLRQFFSWAKAKQHVEIDPSASLEAIKGGRDLPAFRTKTEIEKIVARGGLDDAAVQQLWECLYLSLEEIANLLRLVGERAKVRESFLLHVLPAYTGMRKGEILRLKWLDVDLDGGFVTARSLKQSRSQTEIRRTIELHPELHEHLANWRDARSRGQFVLCNSETLNPLDKDLASRLFWQPLRGTDWCLNSKKNWFKIGFHCYRHSFASNLASLGIDQRVIDAFMGHQTEAMRRRYQHLFPNNRRAAIESFSLQNKDLRQEDAA